MNTLTLNVNKLTARIYHGLKSLLTPGDTLPPRFLEVAICESFDMLHVGDGNFYADGIKGNIQCSIKTRMMTPHLLKRKEGRDFQTYPHLFLGPKRNKKRDKNWAGLEIVQRRQALPFKDATASPNKVGQETLKEFQKNIQESYNKFKTSISIEIIGVHGYSKDGNYIVSLFWDEYKSISAANIEWVREGSSVNGYITENDKKIIVCERINGNAKREATCYKEYKNLLTIANSKLLVVPIPQPWEFNEENILKEIENYKTGLDHGKID